ncbi:MAG: NGG1p interacting factor NIF3 [Candidatus Omnitrophica bacterium 4484_70.1]|nr:MAG: NGG1p interacting factor NIF3 [Candidatus Omnitrophica bacterium 4484_70.1]
MKLKRIYEEVIKKGKEADPRGKKEIENLLREKAKFYEKLEAKEKKYFDKELLNNPYTDTRILWGDPEAEMKSIIVGIDVGGEELLLVDRLREKGTDIDLVISHHPQGFAYATFYEVMDLQVDVLKNIGVNVSFAEKLLEERKKQVERRVHPVNFYRAIDFARWLKINFMCMHTPCDNLAYQFMDNLIKRKKPKVLKDILDILLEIPEYQEATKRGNPPKIFLGSKNSRVSKVLVEFTGGTEGSQEIYERLSSSGIDTIVSMHQSEEHLKKCQEAKINVVIASHIASDSLGVNLMLDYLEGKAKFKIYEFSGFKRFSHK